MDDNQLLIGLWICNDCGICHGGTYVPRNNEGEIGCTSCNSENIILSEHFLLPNLEPDLPKEAGCYGTLHDSQSNPDDWTVHVL